MSADHSHLTALCLVALVGCTRPNPDYVPPGQTVQLELSVDGPGRVVASDPAIDCEHSCAFDVSADVTVTITAEPEAGAEFIGWESGCDSVVDATCIFTAASDGFVQARFRGGGVVWATGFGTAEPELESWIAAHRETGVFVAGVRYSATFSMTYLAAALFDASGEKKWELDWIADSVTPADVAFDANGDPVLLAYVVNDTFDTGCGSMTASADGLVTKRDAASGDCLWATPITGTGAQTVRGVYVDATDAIYVAGTSEGNVVIGATQTILPEGGAFLAKLSSTGDPIWIRTVPDTSMGSATFTDVAGWTDGSLVIAGDFSGTVTIGSADCAAVGLSTFAAVYDADGSLIRRECFPQTERMQVHAIAASGGRLTVAGQLSGAVGVVETSVGQLRLPLRGKEDGFVLSLDDELQPVWAQSIGGAGSDIAFGVSLGKDHHPVIAGTFTDMLDVGEAALASNGAKDAFAIQLDDPTGAVRWARRYGGTGNTETIRHLASTDAGVFAVGHFRGRASFDDEVLDAAGQDDLFVMRLGR